jgi:ribosomal protein L40E
MSEALLIIALGLVVLAAVAYPLMAGRPRYDDAAALEADVTRYREALSAGTVCSRCRAANPPGSRYCGECGRRLEIEE